MATEQMNEVDGENNNQVKLSDIDDGVVLPGEKQGKRRGKKMLASALAILLLIGATAIGGYFLLRGEQIDLKANKRLEDKTASGSDIRKAAYDSISDSLNTHSPAPAPFGTAVSQASDQTNSPPVQPDVPEAFPPPPEALMGKPASASRNDSGRPAQTNPSEVPAARNASQSVRFAPVTQPERTIEPKSKPSSEENGLDSPRAVAYPSNRDLRPKASNQRRNLPMFGAMLPVRLMGALYTLRTGAIARFELTRDLKGEGWRMRRGTIFTGAVVGGDVDRAYVQIKGYIDPETGKLVKMEAETLGDDGGAGLRGKRRRVSSAWLKALDRAAQAGVQIATGILNSGASSVIIGANPYGTFRSTDEAWSNSNRTFVEVPAGASGFLIVTTMPESDEGDSHLAEDGRRKSELADQDLAELITSADPARIRAALPRMNPELRQIAQAALKEIEETGK
jgi:hypothetical protein